MSDTTYFLTAIGTLSTVIVMLWRLNLQKDAEIKALMREMIGLAKDVRTHLQNGSNGSSKSAGQHDASYD